MTLHLSFEMQISEFYFFLQKKVFDEVVIKLLTPISKSLILPMFQKFQAHLLNNFSHLKNQKILLASSGGLDSCVLLSLCLKYGLNISIAHCNFQLRGKHSEEDALWIKKLAEDKKLECHIKKFDTCLLYTSPSPRDATLSRMPSSA